MYFACQMGGCPRGNRRQEQEAGSLERWQGQEAAPVSCLLLLLPENKPAPGRRTRGRFFMSPLGRGGFTVYLMYSQCQGSKETVRLKAYRQPFRVSQLYWLLPQLALRSNAVPLW